MPMIDVNRFQSVLEIIIYLKQKPGLPEEERRILFKRGIELATIGAQLKQLVIASGLYELEIIKEISDVISAAERIDRSARAEDK